MQRAFAVQKVQAGRPTLVSVRPRRTVSVIVPRGAPEKGQIDQAVKDAEEACAGGDQGEWYVIIRVGVFEGLKERARRTG